MKKMWMTLLVFSVISTAGVYARADVFDTHQEVRQTYGDYEYWINEDSETVTIAEYTGTEDEIEIPSEIDGYRVAEIGKEAFRYKRMKSLSVPDSISRIGIQAFEYCVISDTLQLPENVTIGENAFSYADLPSAITIPAGATVEKCAFSYCEVTERVLVDPGAVVKGRGFGYFKDLNQVICAEGSRLEAKAFEYCKKMEKAILCGAVDTDDDAFYQCGNVEISEAEKSEYDLWRLSDLDNPGSFEEDPDAEALEIIGSPASLKGITVTLNKAEAKRNGRRGFVYSFSGTIENNSDEGIMRVIYTFSLLDGEGEEFRSFGEVYDGEDKPIPPHTIEEFSHEGIKWGPQSVPASVKIGISSVETETELPPAHIPVTGEYLYKTLGDEKLANIKKEPPVKLLFHIDQGGYGRTAEFTEGEELEEAVKLLCGIKVGEESGEWVTDNYNWIWIEWEDGSHTDISLNLTNLEYYVHSIPHTFLLENLDEFWSYAAGFLKEDE